MNTTVPTCDYVRSLWQAAHMLECGPVLTRCVALRSCAFDLDVFVKETPSRTKHNEFCPYETKMKDSAPDCSLSETKHTRQQSL
jgi:hypothetical protein